MPRSISWIEPSELSALVNRARHGRRTPAPPKVSVPVPAPAPAPRPFRTAATALETRVEEYLDWVAERTGATRAFVADGDGLAMALRNAEESMAVSVAMFSRPPPGVELVGRASLGLEGGEILHLLVIETGLGSFGAGFVTDDFLSAKLLAEAHEALTTTFGDFG